MNMCKEWGLKEWISEGLRVQSQSWAWGTEENRAHPRREGGKEGSTSGFLKVHKVGTECDFFVEEPLGLDPAGTIAKWKFSTNSPLVSINWECTICIENMWIWCNVVESLWISKWGNGSEYIDSCTRNGISIGKLKRRWSKIVDVGRLWGSWR